MSESEDDSWGIDVSLVSSAETPPGVKEDLGHAIRRLWLFWVGGAISLVLAVYFFVNENVWPGTTAEKFYVIIFLEAAIVLFAVGGYYLRRSQRRYDF